MYIDITKKIVVFDAGIPQLLKNRVFDPILAKTVSHTILPACYLYQEALKRGIQLVTPDIFFELPEKPTYALMISNLTTPFTERLITEGVDPVILACGESPFIASRFYANLKRISDHFTHSFVFKGMRKRLSSKTTYHQMFFPEAFDVDSFVTIPFAEKKFAVMISGNKRVDNLRKNIVLKVLYGFGVKEIYGERRAIICHFADKGFDLYGFGWGGDTDPSVVATYRGSVEDKHATLRQYRFSFCLENSVFEGYVTEKIFDVMFAGCVPIYCGAPDIGDYVPKNTFIDLRDFKNHEELERFLREMSEETYGSYIKNIRTFLLSDQYKKFSQERYAEEILTILEESFKQHA